MSSKLLRKPRPPRLLNIESHWSETSTKSSEINKKDSSHSHSSVSMKSIEYPQTSYSTTMRLQSLQEEQKAKSQEIFHTGHRTFRCYVINSGPEPFPLRSSYQKDVYFQSGTDEKYSKTPNLPLEEFIVHLADVKNIPVVRARQLTYSKQNYVRMTKIIAEKHLRPRVQNRLHTVNVTYGAPSLKPRIPFRQLLIEMVALIKDRIHDVVQTDVKTSIRPLPKFQQGSMFNEGPQTEIFVFKDIDTENAHLFLQYKRNTEFPAKEAVLHLANPRIFQGSVRTQSPFQLTDDSAVAPSELAILNSLICGGTTLSLKAHFVSEIPDISMLRCTLTYLNLSFNNFMEIPAEVLKMERLVVLKLRNNPISEISKDIKYLTMLETLILSFCQLSSLPVELFTLGNIKHLDVSYNKLTWLPNEVIGLQVLQELNLEGNQLTSLPFGMLSMTIKRLNVRNNFMHPIFWKESTQIYVQSLVDLASLAAYRGGHLQNQNLPDKLIQLLHHLSRTTDTKYGEIFLVPGPVMIEELL